jgi:hypothetical protein
MSPRDGGDEADLDEVVRKAEEALRRASNGQVKTVLQPDAPYECAREYIRQNHTSSEELSLRHQDGTFYVWRGTHYVEISAEHLRSDLWEFLQSPPARERPEAPGSVSAEQEQGGQRFGSDAGPGASRYRHPRTGLGLWRVNAWSR